MRTEFKRFFMMLLAFLFASFITSVMNCPFCYAYSLSEIHLVFTYYFLLFLFSYGMISLFIDFLDSRLDWLEKPRLKVYWNLAFMMFLFPTMVFLFCHFTFTKIWIIPFNQKPFYFFYEMTLFHTLTGWGIAFYINARNFFEQWKSANKRMNELQKAKNEFELKALKSQLNPHFLFNNLHTLSSLVHEDVHLADKFIEQLSKVYRYLLDQEEDVLPIEKELEFLESYLFLLKIRFGENLKIDLNKKDFEHSFIPPLTLQLLIENAIKHNVVSKEYPLHIVIEKIEKFLVVQNNIQPKNGVAYSSGIGLKNIRNRYELLGEQSIVVEENAKTFTVKLPIINKRA